jgi:UDPglucose 6-dehydrogenase
MTSLSPQYVIEHVANMTIWDDRVWVNHTEKTFFVPIWRNGNTEFMLAAEQFGYTLEKYFDLTSYTGYAFVRHPSKRLAGQIWRAMQNQQFSFEQCVDYIMQGDLSKDPHFKTQQSFLEEYDVEYLIDLDDMKLVGHEHIDSVIKHMLRPRKKESAIDSVSRNDIEVQLKDTTVIEKYKEDALLCMPTVGIVGVGKIGSILYQALTEKGVKVKRYDVKKEYDSLDSIKKCDIIWLCVDTPTVDGEKDFDYTNLQLALDNFSNKSVIVGCTVAPGTCAKLQTQCNFVYMPFLISQGDVMTGLTDPDCWFIGGDYNSQVSNLVSILSPSVQHWGTYEEAELAKAMYNAWIIQKINFANWVGDLGTVYNADAHQVMDWLKGCDKLITGPAYMTPGWGDGGPCHPRDNLMMSWASRDLPYDLAWNNHTVRIKQAEHLAQRAISTKLPVIILGKSYKPGIDDTTGSYGLLVAEQIEKLGGEVYFEDHLTPGDYCYILAHNTWYGHTPSQESKIITIWKNNL